MMLHFAGIGRNSRFAGGVFGIGVVADCGLAGESMNLMNPSEGGSNGSEFEREMGRGARGECPWRRC